MPKTCHANDRIIPQISDDGDIKGSLLMMNTFYTETCVLNIPLDIKQIIDHEKEFNVLPETFMTK